MNYAEIISVTGREIIDSRGNPTVEAAERLLPELLREPMKRLSYVTAIKNASAERVFQKRLPISTVR